MIYKSDSNEIKGVFSDIGRKYGAYILFVVLALLLEVTLFNVKHWSSMNNAEIDIPLAYCEYAGIEEWSDDGSVILNDENGENILYVSLKDMGVKIKNISINAYCIDSTASWWGYMYEPYAQIDSRMTEVTILLRGQEKELKIEKKMLSGDTFDAVMIPGGYTADDVSLMIEGLMGSKVCLKGIRLNSVIPFEFNVLRFLAVFLFMSFIYIMKPDGMLWKDKLIDVNGKIKNIYRVSAVIVFVVLCILTVILIRQNRIYLNYEGGFHPYTDLARALAHGHTYLDEEPSAELLAMDDPYDPVERLEKKVPFRLDYAYYEGKYYIYFGVVPCVLLYLPYHLVTGADLPGWTALSIMLAGCYAAVWLLIKAFVKMYARDTSPALAILLWLGAVSALTLPNVMGDANNYYAPMLAAVELLLLGMVAYLNAAISIEKDSSKKSGMIYLLIGSTCVAAVAGCRPQMVLGVICMIPVLFPVLFPEKEGKRNINIKTAVTFAIPYLIIAVLLMLYNFIRFGSVLDFGAMKNLTFAFLDRAGVNVEAALMGVYYYLIHPLSLVGEYPYLGRSQIEWNNPNLLANHASTGGILFLYPVLLAGVFCFIKQKKEDGKGIQLAWIGRLSVLLILLMSMITAMMGGLMDRYRMDITAFAGIALISGILCIKEVMKEKDYKKNVRYAILTVFSIMVIETAIASSLSYGTEGLFSLKLTDPEFYRLIERSLKFWI